MDKSAVAVPCALRLGDTTVCSGKITNKQSRTGEPLIPADMQATNQRGEVTILGAFSAALPTRSSGEHTNPR